MKYFKKLIVFHFLINSAFAEFEKDLQLKLILAEPGDTIKIAAGFFPILGTLSMEGKENIVIKGSGINSTILNFSNQVEGTQGLSITNCNNIILEDFTIEEAKGDGIKCQYVNGIIFRRIKAQWLGSLSSSKGAYGLFPVQCENVMIEHCIAIGASHAGIYVGQSNNIIIRNCEVFHNVAGIEIENSIKVDVHSNNVHNNSGGILVLDLPDLIQKEGKQIRVYDNIVKENNLDNFAPEGNIVAKVPSGTGIMIMATEQVEIFKNTIIDNKTAGTTLVSYFITEEKTKYTQYNPYTSAIYIYDNVYFRQPQLPTLATEIGILLFTHFFRGVPDIIYDGMHDPKYQNIDGTILSNRRLCLRNNSNARYLNLDLSLHFESWYSPFFADFKTDEKECDCSLDLLPEVKLAIID